MLDAAKLSLLPKRAVRVGPFDVSLKLHCSSLRQEANPATLNSRLEIVGTGQAVTRADGAPALAAYREMIVSEKLNDPASAVTMAANTALRFLDGELAALAKPAGGPPPIPKPTIFNRNNDATVDRPDLNLYARTKIGTRANHTVNEDSFGYFVVDKRTDPTTAIPKKRSVKGTVADGMGGHVNGAAASGIAVTESFEPQPLGRSVSIRYAHQKIVTSPENTQSQRSMGSTIVTFEWDPDRGTLDFSNIGDSPLYRVRANGGVQRLNRPEVVAWFSKEAVLKALKTKMIYTTLNDPERAAKKSALEALFDSQPPYNEAEILLIGEFLKRVVADNHNLAFQALKYALGHALPDKIAEIDVDLEPGDTVLVCSDGMSLEPEKIKKAVQESPTLGAGVERLLAESFAENHKDYGESDDITILAIRQPDPEPPMIELSLEDVADPAMTQVIQLDQIAATELLRAKQAAEAAARQAHIDLAHKGQVLKRAMKELHTTREQNATLGQQLRTIGEQFAALQAEAASLRAAAANLPAAPAGDPLAAIEKDVQSLGEQWVKIVEGLATASLANEDISSRQQGIRSLLTTLEQPAGTPDPSEARRREIVTKHASELSAFEERENIKTHRREIARLTEEINLANKPDQTEQRDFLQKLVQTHQDAIALEKASLDQAQAAELAAIDEEPRKRATLITRQQKALAELEKKAEIAKKQVEDLTAEKTALATRARDLLARLQLLGQPLKSLQAPETKKE